MARPSKKTIEMRDNIKELKIFKRDNEIYTNYEKFLEKQTNEGYNYLTPYHFCLACSHRIPNHKLKKYRVNRILNYTLYNGNKTEPPANYMACSELTKINSEIGSYFAIITFSSVFYSAHSKLKLKSMPHYYLTHEINADIIKEALSTDRWNYFERETGGYFELSDMMGKWLIEEPLTEVEMKKIIECADKRIGTPFKTIVNRRMIREHMEDIGGNNRNKNAFVELDLTKPIEEIISYVKMLKSDFDNNPDKFKNGYEVLGEEHKVYKCDLKNCEVYKAKSPKPIHGRLADILFIYDCMNVNKILGADVLTKDYIIDEITTYWRDTKNISTESFYSFDEYYAVAKEYIDNERYKDYLSGIKQPL